MRAFLEAIPSAAANPLALAAYTIAAIVFLLAGARLKRLKAVLATVTSLPESERKAALEIATETKLPPSITAEHWIRLRRMQMVFLLLGAVLLSVTAVGFVALTAERTKPASLELNDTSNR